MAADSANGILGGIRLKETRFGWVKMGQDRFGNKSLFEGNKRGLGISVPDEHGVLFEEPGNGPNDLREVLDESPIKVGKAEEDLNVANGTRGGPRGDRADFSRVHGDAFWRDHITKELDLGDMELAFIDIDLKLGIREQLEDFANMESMRVFVLGIDQDIIQINDDYSVKALTEDIVQESLKRGRGIGQTERHDKVFEMT